VLGACGGGGGGHGATDADAAGLPDGPDAEATPSDAATDADEPTGDGPRADGDAEAATDARPEPLPPWRSGPRLRARLLRSSDQGDSLFTGVFDGQLKVACSFGPAADGAARCLPAQVDIYYADADCAQPMVSLPAGCAPATYVGAGSGCATTGYRVGAKLASPGVFRGNGGRCTELTPVVPQDFYAVEPVADMTFAAAIEQREDRGGDLAMRYWKSEDGGLFPIGAWDSERNASCVAGKDRYDERCAPAVVAPESSSLPAYADDGCKMPVGYVSTACMTEAVSAVAVPELGLCGPAIGFEGADRLATPAHHVAGIACTEWNAAAIAFYTPVAPIEPQSLPPLFPVLEGVGRLKAVRYQTSMCLPIDTETRFHDVVYSQDCLPAPTKAGLRCVPNNAPQVVYYADPGCKTPVHVAERKMVDPWCALPLPGVAYRLVAPSCDGAPMRELFAVGDPVTPAKLYADGGTQGCIPTDADPSSLDVYALAPATDDTAVAVEIVTE
jgi:hypothetical protein